MSNYEKPLLEIIEFNRYDIVSTAGIAPPPTGDSSSQPVISQEDQWPTKQNNLNSLDQQG